MFHVCLSVSQHHVIVCESAVYVTCWLFNSAYLTLSINIPEAPEHLPDLGCHGSEKKKKACRDEGQNGFREAG